MQALQDYISELNRQFSTGIAREHSYRPALQHLLSELLPDMVVINEPARIDCGAPDYIIQKRIDNVPVFFVEAKDIDDNDLDGRKNHKEQFDRYKNSLDKIIFTDYLDFHFYENGEWVDNVRLGDIRGNKIIADDKDFEKFQSLLKRFAESKPQKIVSAKRLAGIMASKAKLLASTIKHILDKEDDSYSSQQIKAQYDAFQRVLLHDINHEEFADIYAQTIAYGMFAARMHDKTPEDFSRQEAATLIPKSNPFLRQIFQSIAGYDLDDRLAWVVDDLALTFAATDMPKILKAYGGNAVHSDPMIHFYEDFLSAYNPKLRKQKGVWYTPSAVVSFIVRSVDRILKTDFNLAGLADYSKIEHEVVNDNYSPKVKGSKPTIKKEFHRVQILDPAVGTGTFLAETINCIYDKFKNMQGMWQGYVEEHLLPRLNGFELLMAPYAIAHLKLDCLLTNTGYEHRSNRRFKIYLTNSLEEHHEDIGTLFSLWLSQEANEAGHIKRDTPVMVILGNPPYNVSSSNNGDWIMNIMKDYKMEPERKGPLNERNPKSINDDYVKFIRMSQYFIERNGEGILAFINPHGFLDNVTFRGMRWELLHTFDSIYTLDLHGNSKKKETAPDGGKDENVFDIQQGVSINFFIKTGKKKKNALGKIFHADLYGLREEKYKFLEANNISTVKYTELTPTPPMYFFVPKDLLLEKEYNKGFAISEIFPVNSMGIATAFDDFNIGFNDNDIQFGIENIINSDILTLKEQPLFQKTSTDWIKRAKGDIGSQLKYDLIKKISYRPFDTRSTYYTGRSHGIMDRPRGIVSYHVLNDKNYSLCSIKVNRDDSNTNFVAKGLVDKTILSSKDNASFFPLYLVTIGNTGETELIPNLNPEIVEKLEASVGKDLTPQEIFDYVYGVLHDKAYREKYKEFLKSDFPRIPYPKDIEEFRRYEAIGNELRKLHLMEGSASWPVETTYPLAGNNVVETLRYDDGKVFINDTQYFGNVPEEVWNLFIGGYQPAQKWLKDRKGRPLTFSDIRHYQEIIHSLTLTAKLIHDSD